KTPFQGLLFILASIAAAYACWWFYKREPEYCALRRRKIMAGLRIFGILLLLFIIANPVLDVILNNLIKGKVVVLVDNSQSMSRAAAKAACRISAPARRNSTPAFSNRSNPTVS